jgi:hypothetical protein
MLKLLCLEDFLFGILTFMNTAYSDAIDHTKVGSYDALAQSGGGYFYDEVLEYRVWIHPPNEEVKFRAFGTYDEALSFSEQTEHAEIPLVLVNQEEYIDEPETGKYLHVIEPRITEWQVDWLVGAKGSREQIPKFLADQASR